MAASPRDNQAVEVKSVSEIITEARKFASGLGTASLWYRGEASDAEDWKLRPMVYRKFTKSHYEAWLYTRFCLQAPMRYQACPDLDDPAKWLPLMQHYGLPTRLLDWTRSPLVAAFFSVAYDQQKKGTNSSIDEPSRIWMLCPHKWNGCFSKSKLDMVFTLHHSDALPLCKAGCKGRWAKEPKVLAVSPAETDIRMIVQQTAFTIHANNAEMDTIRGGAPFVRKLIIPPSAKDEIQKDLSVLGIRLLTLFPDLDNLAMDLTWEYEQVENHAHVCKMIENISESLSSGTKNTPAEGT